MDKVAHALVLVLDFNLRPLVMEDKSLDLDLIAKVGALIFGKIKVCDLN